MANDVEFRLKLADYASENVKKFGATTHEVMGKVGKEIADVQKEWLGIGSAKLSVDASGLTSAASQIREMRGEMEGLGESSRGMSGMGIFKGTMMGGLAVEGIRRAADGIREIGQSALDAGMNIEKMEVGLSTFVGDKKAHFIIEDVNKSAFYTPYTTQQLLPGIRGLLSSGLDYDRAKRDEWALANAVAATGGSDVGLERMSQHMQAASAMGKVNGRIHMEAMTWGIPIDKLMAESLHVPLNKVEGMFENQEITYDKFADALQHASEKGGMFAGALDKLSQTMSGKASTIKDYWQYGLANLTTSQQQNIKDIEDRMISGLEHFPEMIANITPVVTRAFDEFNELWPHISAFGSAIVNDLKPLGGLLLSKEFTALATSVVDVAGDITKVLQPAITGFASGLKETMGGVGELVKELTGHGKDVDKTKKEPETNWSFWGGDPIIETPEDAARRELFGRNSKAGKFLRATTPTPWGEWEDHFQKRAMWSAMPDISFQPHAVPGHSFVGSSDQFKYSTETPGHTADKAKAASEAESMASDAIVGGGKKVVNITFKNFVENLNNNANSKSEAISYNVQDLKIMLNQIFDSIS